MSELTHPSRAQLLLESLIQSLRKFIKISTVSGVALGLSAIVAMLWSNFSPISYAAVWHSKLSVSLNDYTLAADLHFIVNDVLMTLFFLAVGMEIRHELHSGSLANPRNTILPIAGAIGGVVIPALIYVAINFNSGFASAWAIPTATDIAFALGVVALMGSRIPIAARLFLLTLAVADDIFAIIIIAIFYSDEIIWQGFLLVIAAMVITKAMQHMGISHALAYVLPGALMWWGFLVVGVHPTLAGVILGLMTPIATKPSFEHPLDNLRRNLLAINLKRMNNNHAEDIHTEVSSIARVQRELIAPVIRINASLHPWVNFVIMPLFALANAGVLLNDLSFSAEAAQVGLGIAIALLVGKPLGILGSVWIIERTGLAARDPSLSWPILLVVSIIGGIGFTMSIFVANLALTDPAIAAIAKFAVLVASTLAIAIGIGLGFAWLKPTRSAVAATH